MTLGGFCFFLIKSAYLLEIYTKIFIDEILCCLRFTSKYSGLGDLDLSKTGHVLIITEAK